MNSIKTAFLLLFLVISCSRQTNEQHSDENAIHKWEDLIDTGLSKWDKYLSYQHQAGYDGPPPRDKQGEIIDPIGLNQDSYKVYSTLQDGVNTLLRISSEYYGCLVTKKEYEKPGGEWNTLDLFCFEDKSLHLVNGEIVMILRNSRYLNEDGNYVPLTKGKIQLQSEAAEIFFKDIKIRKIESLSPELKALF